MVQDLGVDVIVTDHHEIGNFYYQTYAIITSNASIVLIIRSNNCVVTGCCGTSTFKH